MKERGRENERERGRDEKGARRERIAMIGRRTRTDNVTQSDCAGCERQRPSRRSDQPLRWLANTHSVFIIAPAGYSAGKGAMASLLKT